MFSLKKVLLDISGNLQWSKTIGDTAYDIAQSIIQTKDGGYAVAGSTKSFGAGNYDFYIVKFNAIATISHIWLILLFVIYLAIIQYF